jgi:hypothetical protein
LTTIVDFAPINVGQTIPIEIKWSEAEDFCHI